MIRINNELIKVIDKNKALCKEQGANKQCTNIINN